MIVGTTELALGLAMLMGALLLFFNVNNLRGLISLPQEYAVLFEVLLFGLGFVSVVAGLFIIDEVRKQLSMA